MPARGTYRAPALTNCPECRAVRFEGRPCPSCGWQSRRKPEAVEVIDGELGQVDRQRGVITSDPTVAERRQAHGMLAWIARERGYQAGWIAHKYREKYGSWPPSRFVEPVPPDEAMRAWVRSKQIAYAKAIQKARSA